MIIWALLDDRAGNNSQVLGVAEKLGHAAEMKQLSYNFLAKFPNAVLGAGIGHLGSVSRKSLKEDIKTIIESSNQQIIVISAGRRSALVARWIKKQIPEAFLCSIMKPEGGEDDFGLIALPEHDRPINEDSGARGLKPSTIDHQPSANNYFYTLTAPHAVTPEKLFAARGQWKSLFEGKPSPIISVLVGGSTRHAHFTLEDYQKLSESLAQIRNASGGTLFITTSRRTTKDGIKALRKYLFSDDVMIEWRADMAPDENPYLGMLAHADAVIVTGDSVSMCSEAVATGKPVYVFFPDEDSIAPKFKYFLKGLLKEKFAMPLSIPLPQLLDKSMAPDAGNLIAKSVLSRLANNS